MIVLKAWKPKASGSGKARAKPIDYEGPEQAAYFRVLELNLPDVYKHAYHPPNGGVRGWQLAKQLKRQGVKAGRPDIHIDIARGPYHGLRIELKATPPNDAPVSESQKETIQHLNEQGYLAMVCLGWEAAWRATLDYVALGPFMQAKRHE